MRRPLHGSVAVFLMGFCVVTALAQPPAIQPDQARPAQVLTGLDGPGFALAYGENEGILVAACQNRTLHYWMKPEIIGVRSGEVTPHVLGGHEGPVVALAWSGGPVLASAGVDRKILLRSVPDGNVRHTLTGHTGVIRALAMSPDGKMLASAGDEPHIQLWDIETAKPLHQLEGHRDWVMALSFSPDGRYLASAGYDQSIRIWNINAPEKIPVIPIKPAVPPDQISYPLAVAFSPDSKLLAVGGTDGQVRLYNAIDGNPVRAMPGHTSAITALAFHPSGNVLVSASKDRTVRLWNPGNGQAIKTLEGHQSWVQGMCLVNQGTMVASVGADQTVRIWDLRPAPK
jgi:WD40 repeat protein